MTQPARRLLVTDAGELVARHVELAEDWWSRFKGLQFRKSLREEHAILLRPCSSIHTFWMRFAIDVVFLDEHLRVIDIHRDVRPWRVIVSSGHSISVLEMTAGALPAFIKTGDMLCWSADENS